MWKVLLLAINTMAESIRQPVFPIVLYVSGFMTVLSPFFAMFALMDTEKLLIEMGLATILLAGLFVASFSASHSVFSEIERKTVLLVLSKPINRFQFIIGKYIGLLMGIGIVCFILTLVLQMTLRMGAPETAGYKVDQPIALGMTIVTLLIISLSVYLNYFYSLNFCASMIKFALPSYLVLYLLTGFFGRQWQIIPFFSENLNLEVLKGSFLVTLAVMILTSISLMLSTFVNREVNLGFSFMVLFVGMLSDNLLGQFADQSILAQILFHLIPNLQVFQVADVIVFDRYITPNYMANALAYALFYQAGMIVLAYFIFEKKEVS